MTAQQWEKTADKYQGWDVVCDNGTIHPCLGCFTCWEKTPGECVIKDGYDQMGARINAAEEVVVSSRYTYGGFSSFVKNVFDRSLGYVLPYFEVSENEMHHQRRYRDIKDVTFIFRGHSLSEEDKRKATDYVYAVCRNLRGNVREVLFEEEQAEETAVCTKEMKPGSIAVVNCSIRGLKANSQLFADKLCKKITVSYQRLLLGADCSKILDQLIETETAVLVMPLYVDGLPSNVIRLFDALKKAGKQKGKKIYAVSNLGLYESHQLVNQLSAIRTWCSEMGYEYMGALAIGAGEMAGVVMKQISFWPVGRITKELGRMAQCISSKLKYEDTFADVTFPRSMYIRIANSSFDRAARENGLKPSDLRKRIGAE